jgi:hypothetical protein
MAFIQLSLLGIAAEVVTGNTLTLEFNRVRYTPAYYLNDFEECLKASAGSRRCWILSGQCRPWTKQQETTW